MLIPPHQAFKYWVLIALYTAVFWAALVAQKASAADSPVYNVGNRGTGWHRGGNATDEFLDKIQPILTKRCVACHGCYEAPCQLNLQSYDGLRRGFNPVPIYSAKRVSYTPPTRLIDPPKGFFAVLATRADKYEESLLSLFLNHSAKNNDFDFSLKEVHALQLGYEDGEKHQCVATTVQFQDHFSAENKWEVMSFDTFVTKYRHGGMPFALPKLTNAEQATLTAWMKNGAKGPSEEVKALLEAVTVQGPIAEWEAFFNPENDTTKAQQTARYIFEHVFSAVIHFDENPGEYFELVRSRTRDGAIVEIVSEVPYAAPVPAIRRVFYRFKKITRAIVQKTQNVWHLNADKLAHLRAQFLEADWGRAEIPAPEYGSNNMFKYFARIPATIRSRFMMENSRLIVGAMVQGTVCIGSRATYAIADHFWGWFLKPEFDPSVQNPSLGEHFDILGTAPKQWEPSLAVRALAAAADRAQTDLSKIESAQWLVAEFRKVVNVLRFRRDANSGDTMIAELVVQLKGYGLKTIDILGAIDHFLRSTESNQEYQQAFERELRKTLGNNGKGLSLDHLWTGDGDSSYPRGNNPNAWLNITRHERASTVQFGSEGGFPQSIWVLSYSNFERLYYNLVAHFRAWDSITHKLATWRHMSYVRLEGEDLAISLLPRTQRDEVREVFTRGLGGVKNALFFPHHSTEEMTINRTLRHPLGEKLSARESAHPALDGATSQKSVQNYVGAFMKRLSAAETKGIVGADKVTAEQREFEASLVKLQNRSEVIKVSDKFAQFLPNITYLRVRISDKESWIYTLLANRGYKAHNLVFLEKPNKDPRYDTLSMYRGFVGGYPGAFLTVPADRAKHLAADIEQIVSEGTLAAFYRQYAVKRNSNKFWPYFDWVHLVKADTGPGIDPIDQGVVDLSQYGFFE